ncbi:MAG: hypothetical protein HGB33_09835, partial [Syntrophaceae bacterium]|nr:hypothetical protein [Syntrophaceae bacterium]
MTIFTGNLVVPAGTYTFAVDGDDAVEVVAHWAISHLYKPAEGRSTLFNYEIEMRGSVFDA